MKCLFLICSMFLGFAGFAQHPDLLEIDWYLQEVTIDGNTYERPEPDFRAQAQFLANFVEVGHPTCEEAFSTNIVYINQDGFTIDDASVILIGTCTDPDILLFMERHYQLYLLDNAFAKNPFTYTITSDSNGRTLIITNGDGDIGVYGDVLLSNKDVSKPKISIYPNPADDFINIDNLIDRLIERVTVLDISGKEVISELGSVSQLDVSHLESGIYIVRIVSDTASLTARFIKV